MGITLSSLLKRTVSADGHVMIKMEMKEAEYQVLELEVIN